MLRMVTDDETTVMTFNSKRRIIRIGTRMCTSCRNCTSDIHPTEKVGYLPFQIIDACVIGYTADFTAFCRYIRIFSGTFISALI